jgi:polyisoprenoid-binding protein YceI
MKTFVISFLVAMSHVVTAQTFNIKNIYPIEQSHSYIGFKIQYMGYASVRGRFQNFRGSVYFDEKDVTRTSVSVSIEVKSIDTDNEWRDKDLQSDQWFDEKNNPVITFLSRRVNKTASGFQITGDLTIRGVMRSVTIPMTYSRVMPDVRDDTQVIFNGATKIDRIDYGVEGKRWAGIRNEITAVSDSVDIELTILCKRINAGNYKNWVSNVNSPEGKLYQIASTRGANEAIQMFGQMLLANKEKVLPSALNTAGQMLLKEGKVNEAIVLFKRNSEAFPNEIIVYESLGEAAATSGNLAEARVYYNQALLKDPTSAEVSEILRHLP